MNKKCLANSVDVKKTITVLSAGICRASKREGDVNIFIYIKQEREPELERRWEWCSEQGCDSSGVSVLSAGMACGGVLSVSRTTPTHLNHSAPPALRPH